MKVPIISLETIHFPVMLNEVIKLCEPELGGFFIDCTFGGGGYTKELLKFSNTKVIALDRDKVAKKNADSIKKIYPERFSFHNEKFSNLDKVLEGNQIKADSIIFDLGLSSFQLRDLSRGFSFKSKDRIDMSMGLSSLSAEEVINNYEENDLKLIIKIFGEENDASRIARNIIKERKIKKISKVSELVAIIEKSKKKDYTKKINVCTKTFQALRIFVNKEITELVEGIIKATKYVKPGGKIIMVSFHSIEDKIIKFYFSNYSKNKSNPSRYLPEEIKEKTIFFEDYRNVLFRPSEEEVLGNPPSRSAKLRYAIRNKEKFLNPAKFKDKFKRYLDLESINV
jgi:16S rRNA (cytosine1402-N4)-methyltransferase|tara:strand:+ start:1399 stop:2418 length:1020 start_codon:yes stop_codon:yes gene_type:complete